MKGYTENEQNLLGRKEWEVIKAQCLNQSGELLVHLCSAPGNTGGYKQWSKQANCFPESACLKPGLFYISVHFVREHQKAEVICGGLRSLCQL